MSLFQLVDFVLGLIPSQMELLGPVAEKPRLSLVHVTLCLLFLDSTGDLFQSLLHLWSSEGRKWAI
jgi:hypothetical protein